MQNEIENIKNKEPNSENKFTVNAKSKSKKSFYKNKTKLHLNSIDLLVSKDPKLNVLVKSFDKIVKEKKDRSIYIDELRNKFLKTDKLNLNEKQPGLTKGPIYVTKIQAQFKREQILKPKTAHSNHRTITNSKLVESITIDQMSSENNFFSSTPNSIKLKSDLGNSEHEINKNSNLLLKDDKIKFKNIQVDLKSNEIELKNLALDDKQNVATNNNSLDSSLTLNPRQFDKNKLARSFIESFFNGDLRSDSQTIENESVNINVDNNEDFPQNQSIENNVEIFLAKLFNDKSPRKGHDTSDILELGSKELKVEDFDHNKAENLFKRQISVTSEESNHDDANSELSRSDEKNISIRDKSMQESFEIFFNRNPVINITDEEESDPIERNVEIDLQLDNHENQPGNEKYLSTKKIRSAPLLTPRKAIIKNLHYKNHDKPNVNRKSVTFEDPKYGFYQVEIPEWLEHLRDPVYSDKFSKALPEWKK